MYLCSIECGHRVRCVGKDLRVDALGTWKSDENTSWYEQGDGVLVEISLVDSSLVRWLSNISLHC